MAFQPLVDLTCGRSLDRLHDCKQRHHPLPVLIDSRCENQVDMIGHDYSGIQLISKAIIMANRFEHNVTRPFRQSPPIFGSERDKVALPIALQMRQISSVKRHTPCPPIRVGADAFVRPRRAKLDGRVRNEFRWIMGSLSVTPEHPQCEVCPQRKSISPGNAPALLGRMRPGLRGCGAIWFFCRFSATILALAYFFLRLLPGAFRSARNSPALRAEPRRYSSALVLICSFAERLCISR